ncbi:MAG: heme o synthase [Planctomycetota bacterium]
MKFTGERVGAIERPHALADLLQLTKPRIASLVALSAFVGGLLAAGPRGDLVRVAEAALWVTCTAGAASVFNQVLERDTDARMTRTQARPLAAGRMCVRNAILFGLALATAGVIGLAASFNPLSALLALATLFVYVAVYTPLKRVSTLNTVVGAVAGAAPPLLGHVAIDGGPGSWGLALFAILFVWQFPHFMAIAWLYRADYARAGMKMLPAVGGCERMAARAALFYALCLLPVALLPGVWSTAGVVYTVCAFALTLGYALSSAWFAWRADARSARVLLFVSLAYLPLLFASILLDPVVGVAALH